MASLPGSCGRAVFGDKAVEFYRNTTEFVQKHMNNHRSRIFQARFLNQPTVFIGSNTAVRELLHDKYNCFRMGYKDFFHQIYGNSLLFSDGLEAEELRQSLHDLFQPASTSLNEHSVQIDRFAEEAVETMLSKDYILVYEHFKQVTTQLCLSLFLGLDHSLSVDLMKELCELSTVHWHGMISVPLSLSLPWLVSSGFSKALHAKEQLLKIIKKRLQTAEDGFPARIKTALQSEDAEQNLLLFISALVPKALSSLLTSFICCSHLWCHEPLIKNGELDVSLLECILLEVMRIWPPFIGGRRVAIMECTIGGFHIPKNYAVIYLAHAAHLDPEAFPQPESFLPARWKDCSDSDKEKLYCFGGGPRNCIGQHLVWTILKMAALEMKFAPGHIREQSAAIYLETSDLRKSIGEMDENFVSAVTSRLVMRSTWDIVENAGSPRKWLPVSRPLRSPLAKFVSTAGKPTWSSQRPAVIVMNADKQQKEDNVKKNLLVIACSDDPVCETGSTAHCFGEVAASCTSDTEIQ